MDDEMCWVEEGKEQSEASVGVVESRLGGSLALGKTPTQGTARSSVLSAGGTAPPHHHFYTEDNRREHLTWVGGNML